MSSMVLGALIAFHMADPDEFKFKYSAVEGSKRHAVLSSSAEQAFCTPRTKTHESQFFITYRAVTPLSSCSKRYSRWMLIKDPTKGGVRNFF